MTSQVTQTRSSGETAGSIAGLPKPARRRRPLLVIVGLLLSASAAALVAALLNAATATTLVWATASDVSRGNFVEPGELVAVEVSSSVASRLLTASVESRDHLIGQVWAVDLPTGALLSPALAMQRLVVSDRQALVGLELGPGEFPVAGLRPGDVVMVIEAAAQHGEDPKVLVDAAIVESVAVLGDQGTAATRLITLAVPVQSVAAVANAGSAGRASIAVVSQ